MPRLYEKEIGQKPYGTGPDEDDPTKISNRLRRFFEKHGFRPESELSDEQKEKVRRYMETGKPQTDWKPPEKSLMEEVGERAKKFVEGPAYKPRPTAAERRFGVDVMERATTEEIPEAPKEVGPTVEEKPEEPTKEKKAAPPKTQEDKARDQKEEQIKKESKEIEQEDPDKFADKLDEAMRKFEKREERLDKMEIIERVAHGLGRLVAGAVGRDVADLSDIKFDKTDFERKRDRNLTRYGMDVKQIGEARREAESKRRFAESMGLEEKKLAETKRWHNLQARLKAMGVAKKEIDAKIGAVQKASNTVAKIRAKLEDDEISDEQAKSQMRTALAGVAPGAMIDKLMNAHNEDYFFGILPGGPKDADETAEHILSQLSILATNPSAKIARNPKTGDVNIIPGDKVEETRKAGWQIIN
jgi:hypothetical protein